VTTAAVAIVCSGDSTAHGPAITATELSPIVVGPKETSVPLGRSSLRPNQTSLFLDI
jgi:hypothetical protein